MQLTDVIKQRKTVKLFDRNVKIPHETLVDMLQLAQLAPSKANLQPWRFVVLEDEQAKNQLKESVAFNGPPCESASAVFVILADLHYEKLVETILDTAIEAGCLQPQFKQNSMNFLTGVHQSLSEQDIRDQVLIDTSLAAMQLMLAVKEKGYDSHAIGIFDKQEVLKRLNIDASRYVPVMLLAVGKAAVPPLPSARLALEHTVAWNSGEGLNHP